MDRRHAYEINNASKGPSRVKWTTFFPTKVSAKVIQNYILT